MPWDAWYHTTVHTYGSWLRGDPRGWRARHHREHVDGDYKNPPPKGKYDHILARSKALMKRDPVKLALEIRAFVVQMIVERLMSRGQDVQIASLDAVQLNVLHRCWKRNPKIEVGIAKQYATAQLKAQGLALGLNLELGEGIWAVGSHPEPITDRYHFHRAIKYIRDHVDKGAAIWEPKSFPPLLDLDLRV